MKIQTLSPIHPPIKVVLNVKERLGVRIAAFLTGLVGFVNLLSAVTPSLPERIEWLEPVFPYPIRASGHLFSALIGFLLFTLATNLLRRKRVAWVLTVGLLLLSILSHLVKGLDYEESSLAGVLLLLLLAMRKSYTARSDPPSMIQGLRVLIGALIFTLAYGTAGFYIMSDRFTVDGETVKFDLVSAILQTFAMFFTDDNAGLEATTRFSSFFVNSIYTVGALTTGYAIFMLLRPVLLIDAPVAFEKQRAREIIGQYGRTSLARLALLNDKTYFFSSASESVVAYVVKGRAAISLGDPIGPQEYRTEAIIEFIRYCHRNDWYPAFYETSFDQLFLYYSLGFQSIQVGEEAIIDLKTFTLKGKSSQSLRTAVNRLTRTGHYFTLYKPPIDDSLLYQLKPVSDEWLQAKQGSEKQFSIGWFNEVYLRDCFMAVVYNADHQIVAFANLLSNYNQPEVTIDLMRHRQEIENGTMEFLFVSVCQNLQRLGYDGFNLSLSPLAGVGQAPQSRYTEKALHLLYNHFNQFYNFKGLHQFKEKFKPRWEPRYLVYPTLTVLPEIIVGLVRADSGDRLLDYVKLGFKSFVQKIINIYNLLLLDAKN